MEASPGARPRRRAVRPRRPPSRRRGGAVERRQRRRVVLLVDDIEDQREMYAGYLRHLGFEVAEASGGIEAIARTVELRPDVVIMDLAMPGMDGFACTRILKGLPLTSHIPVAALTAHGDHLPPEWAEGAGCDAYFRKPMSPIELAERIDGLLGVRRRT